MNPVGRVYLLVHGHYRASRHHTHTEFAGLCAGCEQWIEEAVIPCRPRPPRRSPNCDHPVHQHFDSGLECRKCHRQLRVLPCVICEARIVESGDYATEYVRALPNHTPCCGAHCHTVCRSIGDNITWCPFCSSPLKLMAGDVFEGCIAIPADSCPHVDLA